MMDDREAPPFGRERMFKFFDSGRSKLRSSIAHRRAAMAEDCQRVVVWNGCCILLPAFHQGMGRRSATGTQETVAYRDSPPENGRRNSDSRKPCAAVRPPRVSSTNSDLTSQQLVLAKFVLAKFNSFPPFAAPIFLPLSFCSLLLPFALLLVCEACPVSVSVRPERLSVAGDSRDPGHHSRFVPFALLLATAARGIGVDGASCGKPVHRDEPLTQDSGVRPYGAASD